jgi:proton glutamate symport protein
VVTTVALVIGLLMGNWIKPGAGITLPQQPEVTVQTMSISWSNELFMIVPDSFFKAASENKVLAIVFCAVMFACAMMKADEKSKKIMLEINEALSQVHNPQIVSSCLHRVHR